MEWEAQCDHLGLLRDGFSGVGSLNERVRLRKHGETREFQWQRRGLSWPPGPQA